MKVFRFFAIIMFKGLLGVLGIYFTNLALSNWHISVGLNVVNGLFIGVMGIAGFVLLYVLAGLDWILFK